MVCKRRRGSGGWQCEGLTYEGQVLVTGRSPWCEVRGGGGAGVALACKEDRCEVSAVMRNRCLCTARKVRFEGTDLKVGGGSVRGTGVCVNVGGYGGGSGGVRHEV